MPSASAKQHRFMQAIAHGWRPSGRKGPSQEVAREFVEADDAQGKYTKKPVAGLKNIKRR